MHYYSLIGLTSAVVKQREQAYICFPYRADENPLNRKETQRHKLKVDFMQTLVNEDSGLVDNMMRKLAGRGGDRQT